MTDIFISYAHPSAPQARQIAEALRALGYAVWWDEDLPAHRAYTDVIEERLRAAKAVVVVWSPDAVRSQWVRAEADVARVAGTLAQISVDGAVPPLGGRAERGGVAQGRSQHRRPGGRYGDPRPGGGGARRAALAGQAVHRRAALRQPLRRP
jgi:hypothetical protein